MSAELTQWFDSRTRPVRVGFYEVDRLEYHSGSGSQRVRRMVRWDGRDFLFIESDDVVNEGGFVCMFKADKDQWRGLASNPAESAS